MSLPVSEKTVTSIKFYIILNFILFPFGGNHNRSNKTHTQSGVKVGREAGAEFLLYQTVDTCG